MAQRRIGQEQLGISAGQRQAPPLDALAGVIDWQAIAALLAPLYPAAKGEPAWPPLAMFKAMLLAVWYDLSASSWPKRSTIAPHSAGSAASPAARQRRNARPSFASAACWWRTASTGSCSKP